MNSHYWQTFQELIATPFRHTDLIWGIVPLYFGLLFNELTSSKANFRTAIQTGFSLVWAGAQWLYPYFKTQGGGPRIEIGAMLPVNILITFVTLGFGVVAMFSGLRRKFPPGCAFLGHTRFVNYFMITIFPMQAHYLGWTWDRLAAIAIFAVPIWLALHFGLMPVRNH